MLALFMLGCSLVWQPLPVRAAGEAATVVRQDRRANRERPTVAETRESSGTATPASTPASGSTLRIVRR